MILFTSQIYEYEIYVPLNYNDGSKIPLQQIEALKRKLVFQFGGLTSFEQSCEGRWKIGNFVFSDRVLLLRVLTSHKKSSDHFFRRLKQDLKKRWDQNEVLIAERRISLT